MHASEKVEYYDTKHYFYLSDRVGSYLCPSEYPGGRVPVSGMDNLDFKSTNAVFNSGDWICWRLAVENSQSQARTERQKKS